jgi:hypothetical protein
MADKLDTQQIEILGRAALTAELMGDGLEVAKPDRDAGIDLIAFTVNPWRAVPIQMKVATGAAFSVHRKYERLDQLVMVYVWNAGRGADADFYAMPWTTAKKIAERLGWTTTESWTREQRGNPDRGGYATTKPSARVREELEAHRMGPGRWSELLDSAGGER